MHRWYEIWIIALNPPKFRVIIYLFLLRSQRFYWVHKNKWITYFWQRHNKYQIVSCPKLWKKYKHFQPLQENVGSFKGKMILKGHFAVFNSFQKRTKNFCPSRLFKFSSLLFGRIEDTNISFRDSLTFS